MDILNYSELRNNLAENLDKVIKDSVPLIITRSNKKPVVMMSLDDFNSYEETIYLLKSARNRDRLLEAVQDVKKKKYSKKKLID
jgi:antitoxin YefM